MPEKKPDRKLTGVFGILNILIGVVEFFTLLVSSILTHSFLSSSLTLMLVLEIFSWVISIALIVSGIALLKNIKWAKRLVVYTSIVVILMNYSECNQPGINSHFLLAINCCAFFTLFLHSNEPLLRAGYFIFQ